MARFYQLPPDRMLIVVDDADLPLGQIRLRPEGSSGGHHGLESVEQQLGTRDYPRLRLGIGRRAEDGRRDNGLCPGPVCGRRNGRWWKKFWTAPASRWNAGGAPESKKQ